MAMLSMMALVLGVAAAEAEAADRAKTEALSWVDANADALKRANQNIWSYAEIGLEETRSAKELIALLKAEGFTVEEGVAGMPTAFVASFGSGRPSIGILAEYDALPGLSQDKVPDRREREGVHAGHGCGHSIFGTASTGAAIAVKEAIAKGAIAGTIKLYGTPAEETGIGKTYMLREGFFRDDDVIFTWHASPVTSSGFSYSKANVSVKFRFSGLPAHASTSPHQGRSALDAVELLSVGVNYMREHVKEDARIHYVITGGGGQPNVVPPETEVWYYIRANKHRDVEDYFQWVNEIARAAAAMSRTELTAVQVDADMHEVLPNRTISEVLQRNLEHVGAPRFDETEKEFARKTQADLPQKPEKALSEEIEPLPEEPGQDLASTDVGDISWFVPVGELSVASYTYGAPGHSWQIVACTGTSIGEKAMLVAAKTLASAAVDFYASPELVRKAKADFDAIRKPLEFVTLIPEGQKAPKSIR
ncbi:MAG TPA: amidohydrolase [Vicinamibacteria bacterium]|nr:amidohydrolase [Vicinamibacteria bacterium]